MLPALSTIVAVLLAPTANAQGFDAHGPQLAPTPARPGSPVLVQAPWGPLQGTGAAGLTFEYADAPLVYVYDPDPANDADDDTRSEAVGGLLGLSLSGVYGVSDRVGVGLSAPVWFASSGEHAGGPALGDLRLQMPVGLVLPDVRASGASLALVPAVTIPSGKRDRMLGDGAFGGGLAFAGGYQVRRIGLGGVVGVELDGRRAPEGDSGVYDLWPGGLGLEYGLWAGYGWSDRVDVRLELRGARQLGGGGLPLEALATTRLGISDRTGFVLGAGTAVIPGVGAASIRAFGGLNIQFGPELETAIDLPEPPPPPVARVAAFDPAGHPVRGATVVVDGVEVGETDFEGIFVLSRRTREGTPVRIRRDGLEEAGGVTLPAGDDIARFELDWLPVPFSIRVADLKGRVVEADVSFEGAIQPKEPEVDGVGLRTYELEPGDYTVTVAAEGMGTQQRSVSVLGGRREPMRVDVVLFPVVNENTELQLTVVSPDGRAVEDAFVEVGGQLIGTTGSGGDLSVRGLADGEVDLVVGSDAFAEGQTATVAVSDESPTEARIELGWLPGSVKVSARGPDGQVTDAMAQLSGPVMLPPSLLGPDGERVFTLRPGEWTLVVSSPALGLQERSFLVTDSTELLLLDVALLPDEGGDAELAVRVLDPDGRRIDGAALELDGRAVGDTSTAGTIRLAGLETGPRQLVVQAPNMREYRTNLDLVEGVQDLDAVVSWLAGSVQLTAEDSRGHPTDALVMVAGPSALPPTQLGEDGSHLFRLDPGMWEMLISGQSFGMQSRAVSVPEDHPRLIQVAMGVEAPEDADPGATLAVTVRGPDEAPLAGAEVRLEERLLGTTGTEGTLKSGGLAPGPRTLIVSGLALADIETTIDLDMDAEENKVETQLAWDTGALEVLVEGPAGPVTDALLGVANSEGVAPPVLIRPDGRRIFALDPGEWFVLASSPTFGIQEKPITLPPSAQLTTLRFKMRPQVGDSSVLLVRVRDEDRKPLSGAELRVDGESFGTTSPGGIALVDGLEPGKHLIEVVPGDALEVATQELELRPGSMERSYELLYKRSIVEISVVDIDGKPLDADLTLEGPELLPPRAVGIDGIENFALRPGTWQIYASAPGLKVKRAEIVVPEGDAPISQTVALTERAKTSRDGDQIRFEERIEFALGSAEIPLASQDLLEEVAQRVLASPDIVRVEVAGHTDDTGDARYNQQLSEARAASVMAGLIELGVQRERLVANGYGMLRPLMKNATVEGRQKNRRVEFVIVETQ